MRTWLHWRTACPASAPASKTTGVNPRSSACAAAARPTGPAPMMATVLLCVLMISILLELSNYWAKNSDDPGFRGRRRAGRIVAAFIREETDETVHRLVVGAADHGRGWPLLRDEVHRHQYL